MAYKMWDYSCESCGFVDTLLVDTSTDDPNKQVCPKCGEHFQKLPSKFHQKMTADELQSSIKKRSDDDNARHQQDRVAKQLDILKGVEKRESNSPFNPVFQQKQAAKKKKRHG